MIYDERLGAQKEHITRARSQFAQSAEAEPDENAVDITAPTEEERG